MQAQLLPLFAFKIALALCYVINQQMHNKVDNFIKQKNDYPCLLAKKLHQLLSSSSGGSRPDNPQIPA